MAGSIINTGTRIGNNVCINIGVTTNDDNILGDHAYACPGANLTGGISIGCYTVIGANAVVNPNISIGRHVTAES